MEFMEVEPDKEVFQPPRDMFCTGRQAEHTLPGLPEHFQYGSELVFHFKDKETGTMHKIVSPRNNWSVSLAGGLKPELKCSIHKHSRRLDIY